MIKAVWMGKERLEVVDDGEGRPALGRPDNVRIRVTAAGVCGTDVHIWEGGLSFAAPPLVLGHEFAGIVDECGSDVRDFSPGERVKCDSVVGCGACDWCCRGATQFCPHGWELGITRDGGWAEWVVAPQRNLHHLPEEVSDEAAAILDVEVFSALRKAGISPRDTVAIFGGGPAGLIALQVVRIYGARNVIFCGRRKERLELGRRLGSDCVLDVDRTEPVAAIQEYTNGRGVDLAFDAAGTERAIRDVLQVVRPQGRVVLYGVPDRCIREFPVKDIVLKDLTVFGALSDRTGWDEVIELAANKRLDLESLITHRFPLEQAAEAVSTMRDRRDGAIKTVLQIG